MADYRPGLPFCCRWRYRAFGDRPGHRPDRGGRGTRHRPGFRGSLALYRTAGGVFRDRRGDQRPEPVRTRHYRSPGDGRANADFRALSRQRAVIGDQR